MKHDNRKLLEMSVEITKEYARSNEKDIEIQTVLKNVYDQLVEINDKIDDKSSVGIV
ncbi:MAG: hypothetical protein KAT32_00300 [Candidatus Moranbacteria bacterium]|nr:hypothetical protein [Candidatus Moranbacteria bacterium]